MGYTPPHYTITLDQAGLLMGYIGPSQGIMLLQRLHTRMGSCCPVHLPLRGWTRDLEANAYRVDNTYLSHWTGTLRMDFLLSGS